MKGTLDWLTTLILQKDNLKDPLEVTTNFGVNIENNKLTTLIY